MRILLGIVSILTAAVLLGCAHDRGERLSWNDPTILPVGENVASLNELADDAGADRGDRACAIFSLFAHQIRPGASAANVHHVVANTNWMSDVDLHVIDGLGGWVPVELRSKDTVFCLKLFPVDHDKQAWVIYFRLSGNRPDGTPRTREEALAFLCGDETLYGNPKLQEFALCFPYRPETGSRIERFNRRGMHVYGVAHHAIAVPARKEQAGLSALAVRVSNQVKVVRTWGDLTQQPTIDAGDGVSVRLGIGASHGPLNSGVLLYCLADGYNYFEHPNITLAGLGPLSVSMRRGEESLVVTDIGTPVMLSYKGWNTVQGCTLFFAKSVLIDAPGRYEITVRAASGRVLARTAIASDDSFYHPWTPFLMAEDSEWEWVSHWDYTFRQTKPAVLSVPGVGIAINAWGGENLQVFSGHANLGYDLRGEKFKPRNPAALLPSLVPTRPDPHLKLSVQHGFVTITSRTPIDCARPDWRLIARWWVNDEPFIPRPGHAPEFGGGETGYSKMKQLCFRLNLEPARLGAHSGDRVALQILICDDWCYVENPGTTLRSFADGKARLTNKVEFVLK